MYVDNRAAEKGGQIISDTDEHTWSKDNAGHPIAVRILQEAAIAAIEAPTMEGIEWYIGKTLKPTDLPIIANITSITLASGVVQAIY